MHPNLLLLIPLLIWPLPLQAGDTATPSTAASELTEFDLNNCLRESVSGAAENMTVAEMRNACELLLTQKQAGNTTAIGTATTRIPMEETDLLEQRVALEALNRSSRFLLTPHKRNYFFPASYTRTPNEMPYRAANDQTLSELKRTEAEFQLSIKILLRENIFGDNGHLYMGYTNHSLWQVYSDNESAPFRETNHQPEFILNFTNDWEILGFTNVLNEFSLNHQSNGQGGSLSRSWNRVMFNSVFQRGRFAFALTPWYRLPEPEQKYPGDPDGDDNPDITHYMGKVEFNAAYKRKDDIISLMVRNNFDADNKGAWELGWSFPISSNLRGQVKYFNGYGHSLIDYNADLNVIALGVVFTDLF